MDSYQKYSNDFWKAYMEFYLKDVAAADLDEVKVALSVVVSHLDYADNFRIYRLKDRAAYYKQADKGCCGSWTSYYKCKSGNIYILGCNYGH